MSSGETAYPLEGEPSKALADLRDGAGSAGINGVLTPEQVADVVVQTMRDERFLALPHPEVARYFLI